jgi:hypothetical protein
MSDWSKRAAQQVQINREARFVQDKKVLLDDEVCKRRTPEIWTELVAMFSQKCDEFNSEPGMANILVLIPDSGYKFSIRTRSSTLDAEYDGTNHRFNFKNSARTPREYKIEIKVLDGDSDVSILEGGTVAIDLESFVNAHLESLLGIS